MKEMSHRLSAVSFFIGSILVYYMFRGARTAERAIESSQKSKEPDLNWAMHVSTHQKKITSQYGQDGSIDYVLKHIATTNRFFVEYGFDSNDYFSGGGGSNTLQLYLKGWRGVLFDGSHENRTINLHKEFISPSSIVGLFHKYGVPKEFDFLSNDLDSCDLWVLKAILTAGFQPKVILAEYNMNFPLESTLTSVESLQWEGGPLYGSSFGALTMLADEFGYVVVDVVGHDILFVHRSTLRGSEFPTLFSWKGRTRLQFLGSLSLSRADLSKSLVDYAIYRSTGSLEKSQGKSVLDQIDNFEIFSKFDGTGT